MKTRSGREDEEEKGVGGRMRKKKEWDEEEKGVGRKMRKTTEWEGR